LDKDLRAKLLKQEVDEEQVVNLLKQGLSLWDTTEKIFGMEFDHSDRDTWIFYSKVNRIRKKHGLPLNKPNPKPRRKCKK